MLGRWIWMNSLFWVARITRDDQVKNAFSPEETFVIINYCIKNLENKILELMCLEQCAVYMRKYEQQGKLADEQQNLKNVP